MKSILQIRWFQQQRYLYSGSPTAMAGLSFGYGIGLPLSRLHAKYLGGSLDLVSLPGYGVDVPWKKKSIEIACFKRWDGWMDGWMYQKWIKLWYC